ncbi:MAG: DUF1778 domain-containing protein [Planctomycetota bacterium]|jgi:uncharacterized protein (DUF1778 family)|nr:DUF1778 domain-containing protein [Planctomycetota bacterium]
MPPDYDFFDEVMPMLRQHAATTFRFPTPEFRDLIDSAAQIRGMTSAAFILAAAKKEAEKIIGEPPLENAGRWELSAEESRRVAEALLNPRPISPRMKSLTRHRKKFTRSAQ